jgi:hypothetical protein
VMATLALLFAMSGSALAAKRYLLNSVSQIDPRVLSKLAAARPNTALWAQITAEGGVQRSSGGVNVTRVGPGIYEVGFGREISGCAVEVTEAGLPGRSAGGYRPEAARGSATAALAQPGSTGVGRLNGAYPSGEATLVTTYGTTPGALADSAFFITVTC